MGAKQRRVFHRRDRRKQRALLRQGIVIIPNPRGKWGHRINERLDPDVIRKLTRK